MITKEIEEIIYNVADRETIEIMLNLKHQCPKFYSIYCIYLYGEMDAHIGINKILEVVRGEK